MKFIERWVVLNCDVEVGSWETVHQAQAQVGRLEFNPGANLRVVHLQETVSCCTCDWYKPNEGVCNYYDIPAHSGWFCAAHTKYLNSQK